MCQEIHAYTISYPAEATKRISSSIYLFIHLYRNLPGLYAYSPYMAFSLIPILLITILSIRIILKKVDIENLAIIFVLFTLVVIFPMVTLYGLDSLVLPNLPEADK